MRHLDGLCNKYNSQLRYLPVVGEVVAGVIAGFYQLVVTDPFVAIKLKLQTSGGDYTLQDVMEEVAVFLGMCKGVIPCIARDNVISP